MTCHILIDTGIDAYVGDIPDISICYNESTIAYCAGESLHVEYTTGIAGAIHSTYWYDEYSDFIIWIVNVSNTEYPPLVNIITSYTYEALLSTTELNIWETEAIKLSLRGVSLIAPSGDYSNS